MTRKIIRKPVALPLRRYFASTLLATLIAPAAAVADTPVLEEILVTSAKRNVSLQEFSGSVSIIDGETLRGFSSVADIARRVPGFATVDTGPRNPSPLTIRGVRLNQISAGEFQGDGSTVASYIDNIPLQGYYVPPAQSLKDLQQVEVLRGPQGTLYGNASIAGLVRYITARPQLDNTSLEVGTRLSHTRHSSGVNHDTDLVVNTPLIDNVLAVRMMIAQQKNQGFIDNPWLQQGPRKGTNDEQTDQARISLLWQPLPEWQINGSYHYQQMDIGDRQAGNPDFTGDRLTASSRYTEPVSGDLHLASLESSWQFPGAALTASLSRYDYQADHRYDQTHYLLQLDAVYELDFYAADENFSAWSDGAFEVIKDSVELRLVSNNDQRLRWLGGVFYTTDELDAVVTDTLPGFADFLGMDRPDELDYYATQQQDLREWSAYGEVAFDLLPRWEVALGMRHLRYRDEVSVCSVFPISEGIEGTALPTTCYQGDDRLSDTLGKFSTRYSFDEQRSIYFSVAEGLRRGGANALPADIEESRFYEADTSLNYELGTHTYLWDQRLRLSAALFHIDWDNIQIASYVEGRYPVVINAPEARSQGAELEIQAELNAHWSLRAGLAYVHAELASDTEDAAKGDRLPGSPRSQWSLGVDYQRPLSWGELDASVNVAGSGDSYTALNDNFSDYQRLDGYTTADAELNVSRGNWRAGIFIHNISDTRAVTGKRSDLFYVDAGQFEYVIRPRTAGISLRIKY